MTEVSEPVRTHRVRRTVFQVLLVAVILAWGFALVYNVARREPEPLDDVSRAAIRDACVDARRQLSSLDDLRPGATPADGAVLIDAENAVFAEMTARLREVEPTASDGAAALDGWLDDWDRLLAARAAHADDLRAGGTDAFELPAERPSSSKPITVRMNEYAEMKGLEECTPTQLRAEITDQPRAWPDSDQ